MARLEEETKRKIEDDIKTRIRIEEKEREAFDHNGKAKKEIFGLLGLVSTSCILM